MTDLAGTIIDRGYHDGLSELRIWLVVGDRACSGTVSVLYGGRLHVHTRHYVMQLIAEQDCATGSTIEQ